MSINVHPIVMKETLCLNFQANFLPQYSLVVSVYSEAMDAVILTVGHPDHVEMHYIDTPMSIVNLTGCSGVGNSSGWTKVASGPLEGDVVVVANPADQGKFVCHDDEEEEVVYKIVYIAIEGMFTRETLMVYMCGLHRLGMGI